MGLDLSSYSDDIPRPELHYPAEGSQARYYFLILQILRQHQLSEEECTLELGFYWETLSSVGWALYIGDLSDVSLKFVALGERIVEEIMLNSLEHAEINIIRERSRH